MLKKILLVVSISTIVSGCESIKTMAGALPLLTESSHWSSYADEHAKNGFKKEKITNDDSVYITKRLGSEFLPAMDKIMDSFDVSMDLKKMMKEKNIDTAYKINEAFALKDNYNSTFGYCVNFDLTFSDTTGAQKPESLHDQFAYLDKNKPLGLMASGESFTTKMCGKDFYLKIKEAEEKRQK